MSFYKKITDFFNIAYILMTWWQVKMMWLVMVQRVSVMLLLIDTKIDIEFYD